MWQKMTQPKYRLAWITALTIAILAISLSFPQVRVIANSFLGLFRVERIAAVNVGIDLADLPAELEQNFTALDAILGEDLFMENQAEPIELSNPDEAQGYLDFKARFPGKLDGGAEPQLLFQPATTVGLTIDQERWQILLDGLGYEAFTIPKEIDGENILFNVPNSLVTSYGNCALNPAHEVDLAASNLDCTVLMQSETPTIEAPAGLDINLAGQLILQTLGMSAEDAAAFSARVDWSTTLVIPVPIGADYRDVQVDGVDGILLNDYSEGPPVYTLLWVKDGVFYALTGTGTAGEALQIANSLK